MTTPDYVRACEDALRDHRNGNIENHRFPQINLIIEDMLNRRTELLEAYAEIFDKTKGDATAIYIVFDALLHSSDQWSPAMNEKARADRTRLKILNQKIAKVAEDLADLLDEREDLSNRSGFYSDTEVDICQVIMDSSTFNGHFKSWVKEPLAALQGRFDMKYWPSLGDCVRVIGDDAEHGKIRASDEITEVATAGARKADADYFKALDRRLKGETKPRGELLPEGFSLTNKTLASLANVALDRAPGELFTEDFVKNLRHRERKTASPKVKKTTA
ncbi:hypothetical protein [Asticcacaulis sp. W401b]|uniref:hypothetical protein n=1 Tax=Asticcacaulis sp. W401b TaxID=3388666 RepID=UPI0039710022